jgi:hypothetical protein
MSIYPTNRYRRRRRALSGMGDVAGTINTAINVVDDPFLPELVCRIDQLTNIEHGREVGVCANTPDGTTGGVGIGPLMPALRAYVFAQQNKWVYGVAAVAILGIPFLLGYEYGKEP